MRRLGLLVCAVALASGQAGPSERQKVDNAAARRGQVVYTQFCINCHGALAKGTEDGPDLIRSTLVLRDRLGDEIGPALKTLPEHKRDLTDAQVVDVTHFLKDQVEKTAKNRNPARPPNVLTGDPAAGLAFFNGKGKCNTCHSVTGDMAAFAKQAQGADLQQRVLFPKRTKQKIVSVTPQGGEPVTGTLVRIDDFTVTLRTDAGEERSWDRNKSLRVEVTDPLQPHWDLLEIYTDKDMHDVVTLLGTLK